MSYLRSITRFKLPNGQQDITQSGASPLCFYEVSKSPTAMSVQYGLAVSTSDYRTHYLFLAWCSRVDLIFIFTGEGHHTSRGLCLRIWDHHHGWRTSAGRWFVGPIDLERLRRLPFFRTHTIRGMFLEHLLQLWMLSGCAQILNMCLATADESRRLVLTIEPFLDYTSDEDSKCRDPFWVNTIGNNDTYPRRRPINGTPVRLSYWPLRSY